MKRNICLIATLILFLFSSCNDHVPVIEENEVWLQINNHNFTFDHQGGEQALKIESNTTWIIEGGSDWNRLSANKGTDSTSIIIYVDENTGNEARVFNYTIKAEGTDSLILEISQSAYNTNPGNDDPDADDEDEILIFDYDDMRNISSLELSQLMGIGWNVGNSLEAVYMQDGELSGDETSWGNAAISQQLIDSVKATGFNAVRIPVSWSHKIINKETFLIDPAWLNRVEEVVNYVLSNQMYAIINIHWDGGWMNNPFYDNQAGINEKIEALWTQIAIHFIEYNDYLLFAGTNEVHVKDNYGAPSNENAEVQNSFNKNFVNAVRKTGERNVHRHLIVQGYNTNIDHTVKHFKLPDDILPDKLMLEVHFYDPYDFALMESGSIKTQWGAPFVGGDVSNWGQEAWVDQAFGKMKTYYVNKGIPVILGEYGALIRTNLQNGQQEHIAARNYYLEYVTKSAIERGLIPFYWDNGYTGNNGFGLFNRRTGEQVFPDAIEAIMKAKE